MMIQLVLFQKKKILYKNHFELLQKKKKNLKKKSFLITLCTCGLRGYQKNIKIIINFTI